MKRLEVGKVYLYDAKPPKDELNLWIMFRVDKMHYHDTDEGRQYWYNITIIADRSNDDLHWESGEKIEHFSITGGEKYCKEIPRSEWTLYALEGD